MKKFSIIFLSVSAFLLLACGGIAEKALEEAEKRSDSPTQNETVNVKTPEADITMSNQEIPKDYPDSLCPIYQPSDILGVMDTKDPELRIMVISLLTEDSVEKVVDFYKAQNPTDDFGTSVILFSSEDGKQEIAVQVNSTDGEDVDEKYNALIVITATIRK